MTYSNYHHEKYEEVIDFSLSSSIDIYTICESVTEGCRNTCNELYRYVVENIQQEIDDNIYWDSPSLIKKIKKLIEPPEHVKDPYTYNLF